MYCRPSSSRACLRNLAVLTKTCQRQHHHHNNKLPLRTQLTLAQNTRRTIITTPTQRSFSTSISLADSEKPPPANKKKTEEEKEGEEKNEKKKENEETEPTKEKEDDAAKRTPDTLKKNATSTPGDKKPTSSATAASNGTANAKGRSTPAVRISVTAEKRSPSSSSSSSSKGNRNHPGIPDDVPQVLIIPVSRRPIFPTFLKHVIVKDKQLIAALNELTNKSPNRQPFIGAFLLKNDDADVDVIQSKDEVHNVGSFAQVSGSFTMTDGSMVVVLRPIRRIKMEELIYHKPPPADPVPSDTDKSASTDAKSSENTVEKDSRVVEVPDLLIPKNEPVEQPKPVKDAGKQASVISTEALGDIAQRHHVSLAVITNVAQEPYQKNDEVIKAISSEMLSVIRNIANLQPFFKEQIASFSLSAGPDNVFDEPDKLADFAAAVSSGAAEELQSVLEATSIKDRLEKSLLILKTELHNVELQHRVSKDVESKISKRQKDYYLMEQLKGIKKELGLESDGKETLVNKFKEKAEKLLMPEAVRKVFDEELSKLNSLEPAGSEFNVTRNYLDWLTQIPWGMRSRENFNISHAVKVLDEDHHGLKDVKDRILEFIAVGKLRGTVEGNIICLVGPPGVGKTSIGKSIARSLERQFYRFSVGGLADVAEIKGHRRTYVGSMPGKVVQALKKVKTENPLILIDEIDKLGRGHQGDPASALLELLDPEQNSSFLDHYMDVPVDLSQVLFVCTANMLDTIPGPLLDRMEVIQLSGYVSDEKIAIASKYLAPAAKKAAGLEHAGVHLRQDAIELLIRNYCRESGVRNLKKHIDKIFRKAAYRVIRECPEEEDSASKDSPESVSESKSESESESKSESGSDPANTSTTPEPTPTPTPTSTSSPKVVVSKTENEIPASNKPPAVVDSRPNDVDADGNKKIDVVAASSAPRAPMKIPEDFSLEITAENLKDFVGPPVFSSDRLYEKTPAGVVMGLAWTSMGGSALYIESCLQTSLKPEGDGDKNSKSSGGGPSLAKTGQMGDVMKESTTIAYTYAKSLMARRFPDNSFFDRASIHLHVPEGATPKDGPSAGITMATSLLSLALDRQVSPTIAMTGELTLTGKVLKIGGLRDKAIAAKRSGVERILFPASNRADWEELPENIRSGLVGIPVEWYEEVFKIVFED